MGTVPYEFMERVVADVHNDEQHERRDKDSAQGSAFVHAALTQRRRRRIVVVAIDDDLHGGGGLARDARRAERAVEIGIHHACVQS